MKILTYMVSSKKYQQDREYSVGLYEIGNYFDFDVKKNKDIKVNYVEKIN